MAKVNKLFIHCSRCVVGSTGHKLLNARQTASSEPIRISFRNQINIQLNLISRCLRFEFNFQPMKMFNDDRRPSRRNGIKLNKIHFGYACSNFGASNFFSFFFSFPKEYEFVCCALTEIGPVK